jgi:hypothetical protein
VNGGRVGDPFGTGGNTGADGEITGAEGVAGASGESDPAWVGESVKDTGEGAGVSVWNTG